MSQSGAERFRAWYARLRAAGLCKGCRVPTGGPVFCAACREPARIASSERYRTLREHGLCVTCKADSGGRMECAACVRVRAEKRTEQRLGEGEAA